MALRMRSPLPDLSGATTWINGEPGAELADKPLLVHFWSISCYICHDVAAQVAGWRERFEPQGLRFVAIHQPRGPEELDVAKVTVDALGAMALTQACAVDNEHALVDRFQNQFVPAYYVFDRSHQLRHFQAGDKGYDRIVGAIERVLAEDAAAASASA
jgi:thiol-disulfide isomerase/thioredoxin